MICHYFKFQIFEDGSSSDDDEESDESDNENSNDSDEEYEDMEIPNAFTFEIVDDGAFIAIFSHSSSIELFYICKVLSKEIAETNTYDDYMHPIKQGDRYFVSYYLEKTNEKKGFIH